MEESILKRIDRVYKKMIIFVLSISILYFFIKLICYKNNNSYYFLQELFGLLISFVIIIGLNIKKMMIKRKNEIIYYLIIVSFLFTSSISISFGIKAKTLISYTSIIFIIISFSFAIIPLVFKKNRLFINHKFISNNKQYYFSKVFINIIKGFTFYIILMAIPFVIILVNKDYIYLKELLLFFIYTFCFISVFYFILSIFEKVEYDNIHDKKAYSSAFITVGVILGLILLLYSGCKFLYFLGYNHIINYDVSSSSILDVEKYLKFGSYIITSLLFSYFYVQTDGHNLAKRAINVRALFAVFMIFEEFFSLEISGFLNSSFDYELLIEYLNLFFEFVSCFIIGYLYVSLIIDKIVEEKMSFIIVLHFICAISNLLFFLHIFNSYYVFYGIIILELLVNIVSIVDFVITKKQYDLCDNLN